jgi:streptogramin lyase
VDRHVHNVLFWAGHIRRAFIPELKTLARCPPDRFSPMFESVEQEAKRAYEEYDPPFAGAPGDFDPADVVEGALDAYLRYRATMKPVRRGAGSPSGGPPPCRVRGGPPSGASMSKAGRSAVLAVAVAVLSLMFARGVAAKPSHCINDCKQDIKSCLGLVPPNRDCTGTKPEKRACRKNLAAQRKSCRSLTKLCKQQNPSTSGTCTTPGTSACGAFLTEWGSYGSGNGQFTVPAGIATDGSENVYVADSGSNRIQKFDANGTLLTTWGSPGRGDGEFGGPSGVATDPSGNVYVADGGNSRIQKFDANGTFLTTWGSLGSGNGQFVEPSGVAADASGNVYVVDGNNRIEKFDANGTFLLAFGWGVADGKSAFETCTSGCQTGIQGSGDGQFSFNPGGVATDGSGNVYVVDRGNSRIQKFDANGTFLAKWGSVGSGNKQFAVPSGIATDRSGNVYVADSGNLRIQKFDPNGNFLAKWVSVGLGTQAPVPIGVATDRSGNVYVLDYGGTTLDQIQKFACP